MQSADKHGPKTKKQTKNRLAFDKVNLENNFVLGGEDRTHTRTHAHAFEWAFLWLPCVIVSRLFITADAFAFNLRSPPRRCVREQRQQAFEHRYSNSSERLLCARNIYSLLPCIFNGKTHIVPSVRHRRYSTFGRDGILYEKWWVRAAASRRAF